MTLREQMEWDVRKQELRNGAVQVVVASAFLAALLHFALAPFVDVAWWRLVVCLWAARWVAR